MPDADGLHRLRLLLDAQPVAALGTLHRGERPGAQGGRRGRLPRRKLPIDLSR